MKKKMALWKKIAIGVLVLAVIGGIMSQKKDDGPKQATTEQSSQEKEDATQTKQVETSSKESTAATEAPKESQAESASSEKVPREYVSALKKAQTYSDMMHMSKQGLYDQLTSEYGEKFSAEAAQYAVDHVKADFKLNALEKAKTYQKTMDMSSSAIYDQLISEYGEKFTEEEAQYAVDNLPQ